MHSPGLRQFRGAVSLWLVRHVCACGTVRCKVHHKPIGKHSNCVQWTKQGAAVGNVGEVLPAAGRAGVGAVVCLLRERGDARSKSRAPQPGAALRFSQGHSCPQRKLAKRKRVHWVPCTLRVSGSSTGLFRFGSLPAFGAAPRCDANPDMACLSRVSAAFCAGMSPKSIKDKILAPFGAGIFAFKVWLWRFSDVQGGAAFCPFTATNF